MRNKAYLSLMEQLVMLLVFALAAAICLQAFVWANNHSSRTEAIDRAALLAQHTAETLRSSGGETKQALSAAAQQLGGEYNNAVLQIYYDENWEICSQNSTYCLTASESGSEAEGLGRAAIVVTDTSKEDVLFQLEAAWQKEVNAHE